jgi:D-alanine-D-alanine ligase
MTVIVLFGGRSDERHVSVASAQNVVRTLGAPLAWFWNPNGAVHDVNRDELLAQGEDGSVQRLMEARGIPFTGSGSDASAAAFDKGRAKEIVENRIRVAESRVVNDVRAIDGSIEAMLKRYEKIVLKPVAGGSSRGLFFVDRDTDLGPIIDAIRSLNVPYILEQFVAGRELTVGVADTDNGPVALPVIEIETDPGFSFDYEGKYLSKGTREICPAKIDDAIRDEAQQMALTAHTALGCEGYSRSDLIAAEDGLYFLELNTLPGLTNTSLVPQQLATAGVSFRDFLEAQVSLALRR